MLVPLEGERVNGQDEMGDRSKVLGACFQPPSKFGKGVGGAPLGEGITSHEAESKKGVFV